MPVSPVADPVELRRLVPAAIAPQIDATITEMLLAHQPDTADELGAYVPPHASDYRRGEDAWVLDPWALERDLPAARWLVADLKTSQARVVGALLARPVGEEVPTGTLLAEGGYDKEQRASGVFRAIGGRCRRAGRGPFWGNYGQTPNGSLVAIKNNDFHTLFTAAFIAARPDLAVEFGIIRSDIPQLTTSAQSASDQRRTP